MLKQFRHLLQRFRQRAFSATRSVPNSGIKRDTMGAEVIIIGAGIAGLALAQGLKKFGVPFRVYEQAQPEAPNRTRYRIRMNKESVEALRYLLPQSLVALVEMAGHDLQDMHLVNIDAQSGEVVFSKGAPASSIGTKFQNGYAMDNEVLLSLLRRDLEAHITYGEQVVSYEVGSNGVVIVRLRKEDGAYSSVNGSLLVAADGVDSQIRRQFLPEEQLLDTGLWCVYGETALTPQTRSLPLASPQCISHIRDFSREHQVSMIIESMTFANSQELQQHGVARPVDYLSWFIVAPNGALGLEDTEQSRCEREKIRLSASECERIALEAVSSWHESLRAVVEQRTSGTVNMSRIVSAAPALPVWTPRAHLTLVGDAFHVMSIVTGSGATTALRGVHHLCHALVKRGLTAEAVGQYEAAMRQYAGDAINASFLTGQLLFGQSAWEDCDLVAGSL